MISEGLKSNSTLTALRVSGDEKEERETEWIIKKRKEKRNKSG